jgi:XRE family aerobic/anaerobic benzoate catabolism transcriptional regulator
MEERSLGEAIARRRHALKQSQEETAHAAGISTRYFADVERGTRSVSVAVARRIAKALSMRLQDLLDHADGIASRSTSARPKRR